MIGRVVSDFCDGLSAGGDGAVIGGMVGGRIKDALPDIIGGNVDAIADYLSRPEIAKPLRKTLSAEIAAGARTAIAQNVGKMLPVRGMTDIAVEAVVQGLSLEETVDDFLLANWETWLSRLTEAIRK